MMNSEVPMPKADTASARSGVRISSASIMTDRKGLFCINAPAAVLNSRL